MTTLSSPTVRLALPTRCRENHGEIGGYPRDLSGSGCSPLRLAAFPFRDDALSPTPVARFEFCRKGALLCLVSDQGSGTQLTSLVFLGSPGAGPLAQIAPGVQAIGVFHPAVANIRAVIHIRDEYVLDSRIDLRLSLPHGRPHADDDQDYS